MIVRGLTREQLEEAISSVPNASYEYIDRLGKGYRVKLRVVDSKGPYHRRGLTYTSRAIKLPDGTPSTKQYPPKRLASLCWHGFREVFMAIYSRHRDAVIITGRARYNDRDHFVETYRNTGHDNIGSRMIPMEYQEACDCDG